MAMRCNYKSYKWIEKLTFEPAALATKSGLNVGHRYCRTEIHQHRDENEARWKAPRPYRVIEEQHFRLDSPVRALIHMVMYQCPCFDAHHVQPEEAGHERELDDECWKQCWSQSLNQSACHSCVVILPKANLLFYTTSPKLYHSLIVSKSNSPKSKIRNVQAWRVSVTTYCLSSNFYNDIFVTTTRLRS